MHKRAAETSGPKGNSIQAPGDSSTTIVVKKNQSSKTDSYLYPELQNHSEKNSKLIPEQQLVLVIWKATVLKTAWLPIVWNGSQFTLMPSSWYQLHWYQSYPAQVLTWPHLLMPLEWQECRCPKDLIVSSEPESPLLMGPGVYLC